MGIKETVFNGVYIVAEIGQNHQGDIKIAKKLLESAKLCGANAVKSQKRDINSLPERLGNVIYNSPNSFGNTYREHRQALELSHMEWEELYQYANQIGIELFASAWDIPSVRFLNSIGCPIIKIASPMVTDEIFLKEISFYNKPTILSTGMSTLEEIDRAVEILKDTELYILQATSAYPTDFCDINLKTIVTLQKRYNRVIGFSGHHKGIAVDIAAVTLGAKIIERHFTLDRTWKGTDHAVSLEPSGLTKLIRDVHATLQALGDGNKKMLSCELPAKIKLREKK